MDLLGLAAACGLGLAALWAAMRWGHARGRVGLGLLPGRAGPSGSPASPLYALASEFMDFYNATVHPADLRTNEAFRKGVAWLRRSTLSGADLVGYFLGDNALIACQAGEALRERGEAGGIEEPLIGPLGTVAPWPLFFALDYLAEVVPPEQPIVGRVLVSTTAHLEYRLSCQFLASFVGERIGRGEAPAFGEELALLESEPRKSLLAFLENLDPKLGRPLLEDLHRRQRERVDRDFLSSVGSLWDTPEEAPGRGVIWHESLREQVALLAAELTGAQRRSVLVVGEPGVGKTRLVQALGQQLQEQGWLVFEAGPAQLVAGQTHYGMFEERMRQLIQELRGQRILWVMPEFHALAESGTHRYSSISALDLLLPHIESGEIAALGECQTGPFERLALAKPRLGTALRVRRLDALPADRTLALARRWWQIHAEGDDAEAVLAEAWELAQQYLGDRQAPGSLLKLLEITWQRLVGSEREGRTRLGVDDLIVTLSALTGLPSSLLDFRDGLDLDALRQDFARRVIGQPEAVECLVERVAMVKAGLTDPTRPFGVFLFAGPTGTGKTEIAKTLAEFLFGSPERMIRIDMSELQAPSDLDRLVGSDEGEPGDSLVGRIREQPFSVILLDEFEKAHSRSWDLFLQLFDDGRLSDRRGRVADFRYSIVILTSNLGTQVLRGERPGFASRAETFSSRDVLRAVDEAFRPEFLNRLDRVVVFRPFDRETMRGILRRELDSALQRRGLRARPWAVEWDPAAIEFLLEKGFSPMLGARPLKRAVERYLLAPVAQTIVRHDFPSGEQFLYMTLGEDALEVQFIDPDAPLKPSVSAEVDNDPSEESGGTSLGVIARDPRGSAEELATLERRFEHLRSTVESQPWRERKATALDLTQLPEFWRSQDRFEILGQYEYQGRIEAGVRRTGSLLGRLRRRHRDRLPPDLVASVAQTLLLLDVARADVEQGRPQDAFVLVEGARRAGLPEHVSDRFAKEVGRMYREWARRRRMQLTILDEQRGDGVKQPFRLMLAVSGFGSHSILSAEAGLHVLESPAADGRGFERSRAQVRVAPQEGDPDGGGPVALRRAAEAAFSQAPLGEPRIVRRYRREPSPLVRDGVRGWRTGRIDRVLDGNFDLMLDT